MSCKFDVAFLDLLLIKELGFSNDELRSCEQINTKVSTTSLNEINILCTLTNDEIFLIYLYIFIYNYVYL